METIKVTIEVPAPPDGYECVGPATADQPDFYFLTRDGWARPNVYRFGYFYCVMARRKQTLADWMNAQPDFQVVAKMLSGFTAAAYNGIWNQNRAWPKPPMDGCVEAVDGKWVDA